MELGAGIMVKEKTIARDLPLAEITLRRYEKPFFLEGRQLIKKFCLCMGLLQPGDSRDVIVDVLHVLLQAKQPLSASEIEQSVQEERKKHSIVLLGITGSNIRRQLRRLQEVHIIERRVKQYIFTENLPLSEVFNERTMKLFLQPIIERVQEYSRRIEELYQK